MKKDFIYHRELVVGILAVCLGVWWRANGLGLSFIFGWFLFLFLWNWLAMPWKFGGAVFLLFLLGISRYGFGLVDFEGRSLIDFHDEVNRQVVEGVVSDYPDVRADQIKLTLQVDHPVEGVALVTVSRYPGRYVYGDRLKLHGVLKEPHEFDDFSYKNYLRRYGVDSVMYRPYVERLGNEARWWDWRRPVFDLKAEVEDRINRLFVEPHASFAAGLLLGSRRGIPEKVMEDFNTSGLTHIIAISGYNITLIIVFVGGVLRRFSNRVQIVVSTGVILIFVILVGGTAAVIRAAIMGVLGLWAVWFGRTAEVTRMLAITAAGMVLWNPFILTDDVGFQLSFAATCGLVYMTPWVERGLQKVRLYSYIPESFSIREAFVTTLAAQTFAVPIIVAQFGRLSLIAPLANVAAVSFIPVAMLLSFAALLISYLWWQGGLFVAYLGWFFLELIIWIARICAEVPGAEFVLL